ncbi:unnamed protein product [Cercospora beticola]|nr:unnamed protein product [Cercospora beticola]
MFDGRRVAASVQGTKSGGSTRAWFKYTLRRTRRIALGGVRAWRVAHNSAVRCDVENASRNDECVQRPSYGEMLAKHFERLVSERRWNVCKVTKDVHAIHHNALVVNSPRPGD